MSGVNEAERVEAKKGVAQGCRCAGEEGEGKEYGVQGRRVSERYKHVAKRASSREHPLRSQELDELFPRHDDSRVGRDGVEEAKADFPPSSSVRLVDSLPSRLNHLGVGDGVGEGNGHEAEIEVWVRVDDVLE